MNIDEVVEDALFDYCKARCERECATQDRIERELCAAIEQHVAEEVAREREELLDLVGSYAKDNADLKDAIRARADNDPNRLPSHRCSSLCSPDETFCAITKDGKCDAMDRSCDAARVGHEVTK